MSLSIETIRMLEYINRHNVDSKELGQKFGCTYRQRLNELEQAHAINFEFERDGRTHVIVPSLEGLLELENYHAVRTEQCKDFWRKSILTPILVAVVTSVLTTNLWPLIWRWLSEMLLGTQ